MEGPRLLISFSGVFPLHSSCTGKHSLKKKMSARGGGLLSRCQDAPLTRRTAIPSNVIGVFIILLTIFLTCVEIDVSKYTKTRTPQKYTWGILDFVAGDTLDSTNSYLLSPGEFGPYYNANGTDHRAGILDVCKALFNCKAIKGDPGCSLASNGIHKNLAVFIPNDMSVLYGQMYQNVIRNMIYSVLTSGSMAQDAQVTFITRRPAVIHANNAVDTTQKPIRILSVYDVCNLLANVDRFNSIIANAIRYVPNGPSFIGQDYPTSLLLSWYKLSQDFSSNYHLRSENSNLLAIAAEKYSKLYPLWESYNDLTGSIIKEIDKPRYDINGKSIALVFVNNASYVDLLSQDLKSFNVMNGYGTSNPSGFSISAAKGCDTHKPHTHCRMHPGIRIDRIVYDSFAKGLNPPFCLSSNHPLARFSDLSVTPIATYNATDVMHGIHGCPEHNCGYKNGTIGKNDKVEEDPCLYGYNPNLCKTAYPEYVSLLSPAYDSDSNHLNVKQRALRDYAMWPCWYGFKTSFCKIPQLDYASLLPPAYDSHSNHLSVQQKALYDYAMRKCFDTDAFAREAAYNMFGHSGPDKVIIVQQISGVDHKPFARPGMNDTYLIAPMLFGCPDVLPEDKELLSYSNEIDRTIVGTCSVGKACQESSSGLYDDHLCPYLDRNSIAAQYNRIGDEEMESLNYFDEENPYYCSNTFLNLYINSSYTSEFHIHKVMPRYDVGIAMHLKQKCQYRRTVENTKSLKGTKRNKDYYLLSHNSKHNGIECRTHNSKIHNDESGCTLELKSTIEYKNKLYNWSPQENKVDIDPGSGTGPKPDDNSGSGTGPKPDDNSGSGTGPKPDDNSGSGTEPKPDDNSGSRTGPKPDDNSGSRTGPKPDDNSGSGTESKPDDNSGSETGPKPDNSTGSELVIDDTTSYTKYYAVGGAIAAGVFILSAGGLAYRRMLASQKTTPIMSAVGGGITTHHMNPVYVSPHNSRSVI